MESEWFENVGTAEEIVPFDDDNDASLFEGERCGICMDIIIDRGVLDCCQHWFCFACIDNWSTITNLCPLCQNEFQLITRVPVYDTIGGNTEEDSVPRDDEWSLEGKNNSLSFPSYYIDENAVTCLDGDECKLRSDSVTLEESLTYDTSIACDSCDTWYHAFCVGFDTESTSVESWLCPRCLPGEEHTLAASAIEVGPNQYHSGSAGSHSSADIFSGKVSVSVADDGETAVVVSNMDQKHHVEEPAKKSLTTECLGLSKGDDLDQSRLITPETSLDNPLLLSCQNVTSDVPSAEAGNILPISTGMAPGSSFSKHKSKTKLENNVMFDEISVSSTKCRQSIKKSASEDDTCLTRDEGVAVAGSAVGNWSFMLSENIKSVPVGADEGAHFSLQIESQHASADERKHGILVALGGKRRCKNGESASAHSRDRKRVRLAAAEGLSSKVQAKKYADGPYVPGQTESDALNKSNKFSHDRIQLRDECEEVESAVEEVDIMSIVQGRESKTLSPADKLSKRRDIVGPRVKKIVRRPVDNNESSDMVQNLRKEIREAIRDKSSEDVGKSLFDPKLLAAFRTAVSVPGSEPVNKVSASSVKAKRPIFQQGSTRENLTKKIYATSSGKRKNAWYRDCQVEFWKHRCPKTTKFEKIETLKSVLGLLKWDPETAKAKKPSKDEASSSILSRLYLADASVFPRKDDIKPISSLETFSTPHVKTKTEGTKADISSKAPSSRISSLDDKKNKRTSSGMSTGPLSNMGKIGEPDDIKTDKRLWAMQVLARKTASISTTPGHQKEEDPVLKGNCPLLAQLPVDMRPKLEACRHNKITTAVRQAQLNRLAENLLRLTNISSIRKTAATELAVADAINIEREIANRSQSKIVYINLCSQELRRQITNSQNPVVDLNPPTLLTVSTKKEPLNIPPALDPEVEKALKCAGLIDDSPPTSPNHMAENCGDEDEDKDKEPDNVLEMDSNPELDIFGEFEYDIEGEDYIGTSAIKESNMQIEEGESKMKVVFSSLNKDKQEADVGSITLERTADDLPSSYASQSDCKTDVREEIVIKVNNEQPLSLPPDSTTEGVVEPSPTECEELYGPETEPLFASIPFNNLTLASVVKPSDLESEKQDQCNSDAKANNKDQPKENVKDPQINADKLQKVHAYIKEHIRPLCKSGIISVEQYRWAVGKTTDKVMKYHSKAKNANFLIKEGEKVKKLAEQYVEAAKLKDND